MNSYRQQVQDAIYYLSLVFQMPRSQVRRDFGDNDDAILLFANEVRDEARIPFKGENDV